VLTYFFPVLIFALHLAIAVVLVRKYVRTHDIGFAWLGVAVVIWPLVTSLIGYEIRGPIGRVAAHQAVGIYPFTLVEQGQMSLGQLVASLAMAQQLIGVILLFVALLYLSRTKGANSLQVAT
jgi:hypothetical protein